MVRTVGVAALLLVPCGGCHDRPSAASPVDWTPSAAPSSVAAAPPPSEPPGGPTSAPAVDGPAPMTDAALDRAIEAAFQRDPVLSRCALQASSAKGTVTLTGTAPSLGTRERAEAVAGEVKGARDILDRILITPEYRPDADVERDVRDALQRDPGTRHARVEVHAVGGAVRLDGTASSETQRELIVHDAANVASVVAVRSQIELLPAPNRSDDEMAAEIRDRLTDDALLDGSHVEARVRGRGVLLRGTVGSLAQKIQAAHDAWVTGVANVDDRAIVVDWRANEAGLSVASPPPPADSHIEAAVRRALLTDPRLAPSVPQVLSVDGVVTLRGNVDTFVAQRAAIRDALGVRGVRRVDARVTVTPVTRESDARIQRQVERAVVNDLAAPDGRSVQVTTTGGVVTLRGTVASPQEKGVLESDAEEPPGVTAVQDDLTVETYGGGARAPTLVEIRDRTVDNLHWDPRVGTGRVIVRVAPDGAVTLSGVVLTWGEARAAERDAVRAGAKRVINDVRVASAPASTPPPVSTP